MAAAAAVPGAVDRVRKPYRSADRRADRRARRGGQRDALGVGEALAVLVDRLALEVDEPAEVVDAVAVLGAQRPALGVDPRQPGRVRAGVGRVDVAAEVVRLGLAGRDERADGLAPATAISVPLTLARKPRRDWFTRAAAPRSRGRTRAGRGC